jgi:hypothetical protein
MGGSSMRTFTYLADLHALLSTRSIRYVIFRIYYEICRKYGLMRFRFPGSYPLRSKFTLENWNSCKRTFFFDPESFPVKKDGNLADLKNRVARIHAGEYFFFSNEWIKVDEWCTNPKTQFEYDPKVHWTKISTLSATEGDIKYVWEKSRFSYLYDLIRYDFHSGEDQSAFTLNLISDWIDQNPVNCGPNWICSQEIALRVLNWTFALHYFRQSTHLNALIFEKILVSIYCQMRHVAANIRFSKRVLHNNHTLTETLALYSIGLLFPFFPESRQWRENGKKWFEAEIATQIFEDGTFIQFSMNYHRIAVQLLTWAIRLGELNEDRFSRTTYKKAGLSLEFLQICQDKLTGWLANSGNNDGALFFPLSDSHFRDFRPQLATLSAVLNQPDQYGAGTWNEEAAWFGLKNQTVPTQLTEISFQTKSFPNGGYYVCRDRDSVTLLRCAYYHYRPFQADNLHLDIWVSGQNLLRDAGTYSYNSKRKWMRYFAGTKSHNTVVPGNHDQMLKGSRFSWSHWIKKAAGAISVTGNQMLIDAQFTGFTYLKNPIVHRRRVTKTIGKLHWIVEDWIENAEPGLTFNQIWHPNSTFLNEYEIIAQDEASKPIIPVRSAGWYSETYGKKVESTELTFPFTGKYIRTNISKLP